MIVSTPPPPPPPPPTTTTPPPPPPPPPPLSFVWGSGLGYHVPLKGVCDAYVQCGSAGTVSSCSAGKYFNGQRCEDCHLVNCQYDPCRGKPDGRRLPDRQTCNGFFTCWSGRSVYDRCPSGQRFAKGRCVYDGTCNNGHPYPNVGSCDGYNYIASPEYPGVFFQLDAGGVYRKRPCPAGLVFDTSVCVCNYPDDYYGKKHQPGPY
ncbi:hypothetical protein C0Q70_09078 [Pomacea canaliculata]|uniref:Chitin-binding type-2 domain-containing protein n=1 Tax=Pomacea canaliculata TaxID=400727 RepID=A0A2T7P8T7_POMCA|nr:hypothetical protein C0Q70_09078 [Pomacea canaliculata]